MKKYAAAAGVFLVTALLWHGASAALGRAFLPGPAKTLEALVRLAGEGSLWRHLGASLSRILWALFASAVPAAALGLAAGRSARLDSVISPLLYLLHPLPKAAFLPVIMLFFGLGEASKIFLVAFIVFSQLLVNLRDAAKQVPPELVDAVRSLGASKTGTLVHVIIPATLPAFFTGLRVSLGTATAVLFLAETFASQSGLGYFIMDAWARIAYPEMYAGILALSVMGLVLFAVTDLAERAVCRWR